MKVVVIMSTYNGETFLKEQIESVLHQSNISIKLLVRDDGSKDSTTDILNQYKDRSLLEWYSGPNLGPAKSFLDCLAKAPDAEYYAFCDQDDVWDTDKLSFAIEKIKGDDIPAMYCSDTLLVDKDLYVIRKGNIYVEGSFMESLISNPVTGCTMVINKTLRDLVLKYKPLVIDMHDWWIYRICMAVNGYFYFDKKSHIRYRQHSNNVIGGRSSKWSKIKRRIKYFLRPSDGIRYQMAKELYYGFYEMMPVENKSILDSIFRYKDSYLNTLNLLFNRKYELKSRSLSSRFKKAIILRKF